jgi:hypothetical protein
MNKYIHAAIWFGLFGMIIGAFSVGAMQICEYFGYNLWCVRPLDHLFEAILYFVTTYASLSLLTLPLPDAYFRAWWNFGRWMIVPAILVSLYIHAPPHSTGFLGDEVLYIFFLAPLYALLTLISLFRIARVWWKRRTVETPTT